MSRSAGSGKKRRRKLSARQRRIYRRRRIVVGVGLVLTLALVVFCVYSLGRGVAATWTAVVDGRPDIEREAVPTPQSGSRTCSAADIRLELSAASGSVPVGGSLDFSAGIVYTGTGSCRIDGSNAGRVLTITSGNEQIWRSDSCPVDARPLLMADGDRDEQTITWNTNRSGTECVEDSQLPKVNPGTYVARLSLKDNPDVASDPVTFVVQ